MPLSELMMRHLKDSKTESVRFLWPVVQLLLPKSPTNGTQL
jgi:hypothetical protein